MNLDLSEAPGPDCIPLLVLRNYEPDLSHILAELLMCLNESFFSTFLEGLSGGPCI